MVKVGLVVAAAAGLVAVWALTPVRHLADPDAVAALIAPLTSSPLLPLYLLAAFLVAGAFMVSVWLVILQTCLLYPPIVAFPLALVGATMSAVFFFGLGHVLGRDVVAKLAPVRVQQALQRVTLESIVAIRVLPILPFTLVNLSCGAFGVPWRTFVGGTVVGMAPGVLGMTFLGARVLAVIKDPSPSAIVALVVVVVALIGVARVFRRRAAARYVDDALQEQQQRSPPSA